MQIERVNRLCAVALCLAGLISCACARKPLPDGGGARDGESAGGSGGFLDGAVDAVPPLAGIFVATGSMATSRYAHTANLLPSGEVLIAGGWDGPGGYVHFAGAEIYNPASGAFTAAGDMVTPRTYHTATSLTNDTVLLAGGSGLVDGVSLAVAEFYDPATRVFTTAGSMAVPRDSPTATRLLDGKVLIIGGVEDIQPLASAEVFDPVSGRFTATGTMASPREAHTATLLPNGKVLVVGGHDGTTRIANAELYDPDTGGFTDAGSLLVARGGHRATALPDGTVLLTGGRDALGAVLGSAELYDPVAGRFTRTSAMSEPRVGGTSTLLANGTVLLIGGVGGPDGMTILATAELYDPAVGTFASTGGMSVPSNGHTATRLLNSNVLIAGGSIGSVSHSSAGLYQ
jgi:hypothetical protein